MSTVCPPPCLSTTNVELKQRGGWQVQSQVAWQSEMQVEVHLEVGEEVDEIDVVVATQIKGISKQARIVGLASSISGFKNI